MVRADAEMLGFGVGVGSAVGVGFIEGSELGWGVGVGVAEANFVLLGIGTPLLHTNFPFFFLTQVYFRFFETYVLPKVEHLLPCLLADHEVAAGERRITIKSAASNFLTLRK